LVVVVDAVVIIIVVVVAEPNGTDASTRGEVRRTRASL
jgi:hypothetical protein